jgi:diguanylate cyclase (GGDEF)-like protein/PAS domain S-box-containing protein
MSSKVSLLIARRLCLAIALAASPCVASEPAAKVLTVVMDDNYPPYVFRDSSGTLDGYLVDFWALWEHKTGVHVDLIATDWGKAQARMARRQADVIDTIFRTPAREQALDFTPPYARIPVTIYTHASIGGITDLKTLQGFLVGVKAGDACADKLNEAGITTQQAYANYQALIQGAVAGQIKVFCLDEPPANYLLYRSHAERNFHKAFELYTGEFHRAVRKGDAATMALLDQGLAAITPAERQALQDKWMGSSLAMVPYGRYLGHALLVAAVIGGVLVLWAVTLRRVVQQRTAQLDTERGRLRTLVQTIPDMIWLKDPKGVYLSCNPVFERFSGIPEAQVIGKTDHDLVDKALADSFRENDQKAMLAGKPCSNEEWLTFAEDHYRGLFETIKTPLHDSTGRLIGVLGIARDITHRKAAEDEIKHLAFYDSLTSLPNRRLLQERLMHALAASARSGRAGALLFIDLDNFKYINDAMGHDKGDLLLQQVGQRLLKCVRESDTVARLGGDEFVVMLEDLSDSHEEAATLTEVVGEKILSHLSQPYDLAGKEHHGTTSIGITLFSGHDDTMDDLLRRADLAMYKAKAAGRNTLRFFDPAMQAVVTARAELETDMRRALQQQEFLLHYQPQVDNNGLATGAEVLVRWQHPRRGMVPPGDFIHLAEESGLILPLGQWVMQTACAQLVDWAARPDMAHLTLAVNVSAHQFRQADFVQQVLALVQETGANPHRLKLELTESLLLDDVEDIIAKMVALKAHGIAFSLDDFGTGYSSLYYLKRLPLYQLKIDRSFVRDVLTDPHDAAIARAIVALAQNLGLSVIAEGVETQAQRAFLAEQGCLAFQGYLFSKPVTLPEFEAWLMTSRPSSTGAP